jgi:uncharacterized protein YdaU (DUF1376 family)
VNFYEHHIRDYDTATSHLSWDEDLAYTRLMRWYYRKEQPIPADLAEACRQVRATTKQQKDAVARVLQEFFELREDGWHQHTCDQVIAAYLDGEPDRNQKKVNEDTRLKRHREERRALFATLNAAGAHAPWNLPIGDLRSLVEKTCSADPATRPATAPATPATATHGNASPVPTSQYPLPSTSIPSEANASAAGAAPASPMSAKEQVWTIGLALLGEKGRPYLGKQAQAFGDELLAAVLADAVREQPVHPQAWITKACTTRATAKPNKPPRVNGTRSSGHTGFDSMDYREGCADGSLV